MNRHTRAGLMKDLGHEAADTRERARQRLGGEEGCDLDGTRLRLYG